jgi:hypothetical protein
MNFKNLLILLFGSSLLLFFTTCKEENLPLKVLRFEQDLLNPSLANDPAHYQMLKDKYPLFFESYCKDMLGLDPLEANTNFSKSLAGFISYPGTVLLKHEVDSVFPNLEDFEIELGKSMHIFKKEFRSEPIPQFISFISEFGYAHVTYDSTVGVGLDFYLGENYPIYQAPSIEFPEFMVRKLRKEYMLPNTLKAFAIGKFESQLTDKRLLALMLFEGKIKYFIKKLSPNLPDSILFGYSTQQLKWCEANEGMIWKHLASTNLLFSKDGAQFMRYINDGPFTIAEGVPQESAPSIAIYTGFKIIEKFVEEEGVDSLKELMDNNKWDEILKKSSYKPTLN